MKNINSDLTKGNKTKRKLPNKLFYKAIAIGMFFAMLVAIVPLTRVGAAGTISGTVYIDYNMNGVMNTTGTAPNYAVDTGVSGVTVTAYASDGTSKSTTTATNGTYSIDTSAAPAMPVGPYRIEFTNLPSGFNPSSVGSNNASSVRFVSDGTSSGNDFGITRNLIYSENDPQLATACYVNGNPLGGGTANADALIGYPYSSAGNPANETLLGLTAEVGAVWGLAWQPSKKRLFSAATVKRHVGLGPQGVGGIYVTNFAANGTPTSSNFVDLEAAPYNLDVGDISDNTTRGLPAAANTPNHDAEAFAKVGKVGIGDIDMSEDGNTLWGVNLRASAPSIFSLDVSGNSAGAFNNYPLSGFTGLPTCTNGVFRPWGLTFKNGVGYLGGVCSAETSGTRSDLRAYVLEFDPSSPTAFTTRFNNALDYDKGYIVDDGGTVVPNSEEWYPWLDTFSDAAFNRPSGSGRVGRPTPILADIEITHNDAIVLSFVDRAGTQLGYLNYSPVTSVNDLIVVFSGGDIVRGCPDGSGGWNIESNGSCGGATGTGVGNGEGNGGGEFFGLDNYLTTHQEVTSGGSAYMAGSNELVSIAFDPFNSVSAQGQIVYNFNDGTKDRGFEVFENGINTTNGLFGKANGLGDIELMKSPAPLQVGNRVWNDVNGNGVQEPGEANIQNVEVELWADTDDDGVADLQVGTTTTDANGNYLFGGPSANNLNTYSCGVVTKNFSTRISAGSDDAEQLTSNSSVNLGSPDMDFFNQQGSGESYTHLGTRFTGVSVPKDATINSSYIEFFANDDAGVSSGSLAITVNAQNAGNPGTFTTANNNISSRTTISGQNVTWNPSTWTSSTAHQTPSLNGIVQSLVNRGDWASGNSMAFIFTGTASAAYREAESYNANPGEAAKLVINYSYTATCNYAVEPNTAYEVRLPAVNFNSGQALDGLAPTNPNADGSGNGDVRDSDGLVLSGSEVIAPFTTGDYSENDHRYDFGFKSGASSYSVGNRLWFDTDNDGVIDVGEGGIPNVSVSIFLDADANGTPDTPGSPITTTNTDADGYYRFDSLSANNYVIRVNSTNFASGNALAGYQNTANGSVPTDDGLEALGAGSNADNGVDPANGGDVANDGILSNTFTLGGAPEPSAENDVPGAGSFAGQGSLDAQADMTVDFGFYKLSLSGTLWQDTGLDIGSGQLPDNGVLDANENRISGIRVRLYDSAGNEVPVGLDGILGTADDALSGVITDGNGDYTFEGLPEGDYRVVIDSVTGTSSTPTENDPDDNGDNNDNGFPDNTGSYPGRVISGVVTLTAGNSGALGNNVITPPEAKTENPTVDFGFFVAPTLVEMDKLSAYFDGQNVVVEWSTGDEIGNLGFNVYRDSNGGRELLTDAPIAGSALKSGANLEVKGNSYRWIDKGSKYGGIYYVEDIDVDGIRTLHGPVQPSLKFGFDSYGQTSSKLMSDMIRTEKGSSEKEFIDEAEMKETSASVESLFSADPLVNRDKQREIAAMKGIKLYVKEDGWYRVSIDKLAYTGFDVNSDRNTWQMFVKGSEVPLQIGKDTVEFYGEGLDTNITDEQVYYLVAGKETGMRLRESKGGEVDGEVSAYNYDVTVQRKDRAFHLPSLLNGEKENWFGPLVFPSSETVQTLAVSDPYDDGTNQATVRVKLQGLTDVNHLVNVKFNDLELGVVQYSGKGNQEFEFTVPMSALYSDINAVKLQSVGSNSDISLVDSVSLRYTKGYTANAGRIRFSLPAYKVAQVGGFEQEGIEVFEIGLNGNAVGKVKINEEKVDGKIGFRIAGTSYDREFLAVNRHEHARSVARIEMNVPSSLSSNENKADFVIITPNSLRKEANNLAQRRQSQGWNTVLVNIEDIYDEYSFGVRSNNAIKAFLEEASSKWELQPNYVLLFGDSSADHRNYLNQEDRDLIPTKLIDTEFSETSSDGWLADFDDDGIEDMAIGRLPVGNTAEARLMLVKLERFDDQKGRVKNTNLLIADNFFESYNDSLEARLPEGAGARRVNRSEVSDPQMKQDILTNIALDPMVVTYTGHGSTGIWASANVLRDTDVAGFSNNKLAFFMLMTCLNGYTHSPYSDSLAEVLVKTENGAIAAWASSGETYASGQILMSRNATDSLFNLENNPLPIGDLTRSAKQSTTDMDARRTWQLIGDPTIVIK